MNRSALFFRMLRRALSFRRGHTTIALVALTVAACVATALLNLYFDLDAKLHKEFRAYGANVVVSAAPGSPASAGVAVAGAPRGQALPADALSRVQSMLPPQAIAVPFAYAVAHTQEGTAVVVAGTDFSRVQQLDRWWSVTRWPTTSGEALAGERVAKALGSESAGYLLFFGEKPLHVTLAGTLKTGADEENRIYISLPEFQQWTGLQPSNIEIAIPGSQAEITSAIQRLSAALPNAEVRPVRQIVEAEASVITKTKLLMLSAMLLIAITVMLCVLATLTSSVLERRRDFALMRALGSSQALLNLLFASEAAFLGVAGALLGYGIGAAIAAWIGEVNFHATVWPRSVVFPMVLGGTIVLALLASLFPLAKMQRIQPAGILKGE